MTFNVRSKNEKKTQKSNDIFLNKSLRNSISEVDNKHSNASKQYQL